MRENRGIGTMSLFDCWDSCVFFLSWMWWSFLLLCVAFHLAGSGSLFFPSDPLNNASIRGDVDEMHGGGVL